MKNKNNSEMLCPCCSGNFYVNCCKSFHQGTLPDSAIKLMRSRYSAYALNIPEYIINTTHPGCPYYNHDIEQWAKKITEFCLNTQFNKLEILNFQEKEPFATVTFVAHLYTTKKN